jgi:peroxiredoxin
MELEARRASAHLRCNPAILAGGREQEFRMSLEEELRELRDAAKTDEKLQAAYEDLINRLGRAETAERALKIGDRMPSFVLPNAEGRLVFSDELLAQGPLVVSFFRGNWCPYCRKALKALEAALPSIESARGRLVALTPETGHHLADTKREQRLSYEVLSDLDGAVGLQFGVLYRAPAAYRAVLAGFGIDLAERHGNEAWFIPMPASFVVDRSGTIRYAFVDVDFTHRAEPEEIVAVLRKLEGGSL